MPAIEFDNVSFSYDDDKAVLNDASFSVGEGEFVALIGLNGSGKSTVAKIVDAFYAPDKGSAKVLGYDISSIAGTDDAFELRRQIGFVFQNPDDQLAATRVVDEVSFGPRNLGLPREEIIRRVDEALAAVAMTEAVGRDVNTLSGGQKQRIAIADALAMQPKLLVLDEPTSMLDSNGKRDVMRTIEKAHAAGIAILLVTHDPAEAMRAQRVLLVEDGCVKESRNWPNILETAHGPARPARVTTKIDDDIPPIAEADTVPIIEADTVPIIEFEDVSFRYGSSLATDLFYDVNNDASVLKGINLKVYPGELFAISGPNGSGKTTLVQHMNGLLRPTSGVVFVNGTSTSTKEGANAARRAVGTSFQYPERSLFADTVRDDIAFGPRNMGLSEEEVNARVLEAMEAVSLPYGKFSERSPFTLSGGEQRKVAIAGVMAMRPQVLVLDEPCASMDAPTHNHFIELFSRMKAAGQTIVLVTHDETDVELLADRVYRL